MIQRAEFGAQIGDRVAGPRARGDERAGEFSGALGKLRVGQPEASVDDGLRVGCRRGSRPQGGRHVARLGILVH